jgi:hypothetical protein
MASIELINNTTCSISNSGHVLVTYTEKTKLLNSNMFFNRRQGCALLFFVFSPSPAIHPCGD